MITFLYRSKLRIMFLVFAIFSPVLLSSTYYRSILVIALLYAVVAASWDLTLGYAGVFNFAHLATFGLGSYATCIFALKGVPPVISLVISICVAVIFNFIVAIPIFKLRGVFVALVTFGAGQFIGSIALGWNDVTGGSSGLVLVPYLVLFGFDFNSSALGYIYLSMALLIITTFYLKRVTKTSFGLSLIASRDSENYALSRGIPAGKQRFLSLIMGAVFTSAAGGVFALYVSSAAPTVFGFGTATLVLSMVLVGGTSTIYGPVFAAIILTFIQNTRQIAGLGPVTYMIVAIIIILILRFLPSGLWEITTRSRKSIHLKTKG